MAKISWFEILADDNVRAKTFYEQIFGWKFEKTETDYDYWMLEQKTDDDIGGGIMNRDMIDSRKRITGYVDSLPVDSVDKHIEIIKSHGGQLISPKHAIPGFGWHAYFLDTEGNTFGIMDNDTSAK